MQTNAKTRSKTLPIVITLCVALVLISAVGGWVYIHQQQVAQKNRELVQQRELKEKEIEAQKEAAKIEADGQRDAARKACQATGKSWFEC